MLAYQNPAMHPPPLSAGHCETQTDQIDKQSVEGTGVVDSEYEPEHRDSIHFAAAAGHNNMWKKTDWGAHCRYMVM